VKDDSGTYIPSPPPSRSSSPRRGSPTRPRVAHANVARPRQRERQENAGMPTGRPPVPVTAWRTRLSAPRLTKRRLEATYDPETVQEADGKAGDDAAESAMVLKAAIKILYGEFLAQFRGTIVTTPVAAADATVRGNFKPALVLMDEPARMRELTSLIGIAFYSPLVWILTGDPMQSPPHINVEHDLKNGILTSNPFAPTLMNSTLSRRGRRRRQVAPQDQLPPPAPCGAGTFLCGVRPGWFRDAPRGRRVPHPRSALSER